MTLEVLRLNTDGGDLRASAFGVFKLTLPPTAKSDALAALAVQRRAFGRVP